MKRIRDTIYHRRGLKLKQLLTLWQLGSKKKNRVRRLWLISNCNKHKRKIIRDFQKRNNGKHPDIKHIPYGEYCDNEHDSRHYCQYYYTFPAKPDDIGNVATGQTIIGGCKLINKTDNDMNGFGLLWDSCKECPFNYDK